MPSSTIPDRIIPRAFPGISPEEVAELLSNSRMMEYPAEMVLCRENATEDVFYIILEGKVEVTKVINNNEERLLKQLGPGDFFGEMALIHNAPRAATVKTITHLVTLEIHKEAFERVLENSSSISLAMVREISQRLRENDEMAIDDLRMRASELAEAYQKLAEQEVARREFLTNIAHQLRTPLMAANGFLQMIQKGAVPAARKDEVINTVARNVQQIVTLVNDILFVQEMDLILGNFQPVHLPTLIENVILDLNGKARDHQVQVNLLQSDVPAVPGDARTLERAIAAILDNAIKFSPQGGKVTIQCSHDDENLTIAISDHGIGIEAVNLDRVFDRYYHTDRAGNQVYEGLGLGLAIARQVVDQHRGRITIESIPGEGSTFTIWLRLEQDNANDPSAN